MAAKIAIPTKIYAEQRLIPRDLVSADELFLTSTVMEIVPVSRLIVQKPRAQTFSIGSGRPGPVTQDLHARYRAAISAR